MNAANITLEEIRERWKGPIALCAELDRQKIISIIVPEITNPARDISYLLNRLDAAEKAARGTWKRCEMLAAEIRKMKGE